MENPITCPACSSQSVTTNDEIEDFDYHAGGNEYAVHAVIPVHTCTACGESFLSDAGENARHRAICAAMQRLTPEDILALRQRLGLSRKAFAELSGVGEASLARWETGEFIQSESNDNLLRLLLIDENVNCLATIRGITRAIAGSSDVLDRPKTVAQTPPQPGRYPAARQVDLSRYPALRPGDELRLARERRSFRLRRASGS
jgi:putative zinc finger/helix-turn-helix YgiT family protein